MVDNKYEEEMIIMAKTILRSQDLFGDVDKVRIHDRTLRISNENMDESVKITANYIFSSQEEVDKLIKALVDVKRSFV